jgi:hypothetical protein
MDPARTFMESLTPRPELENKIGTDATYKPSFWMSVH